MRIAASTAAALLAAGLLLESPLPAAADDYAEAFVAAFAEACVPERLSFAGTQATAEASGWMPVGREAHPELAAVMGRAEAALESDKDLDPKFEAALFQRAVAGRPHHLVVTRSEFTIEKGDEPWVFIGCYLYNFDATGPIDPAPVTALIGKPISHSHDDPGLIGHVWGPPCPMPRTGDTYLSFIPDQSSVVAATGFSGLVLKFSTSEPDPGEVVPETYC